MTGRVSNTPRIVVTLITFIKVTGFSHMHDSGTGGVSDGQTIGISCHALRVSVGCVTGQFSNISANRMSRRRYHQLLLSKES